MSESSIKPEPVGKNIRNAMDQLSRSKSDLMKRTPIPFEDFLSVLYRNPSYTMRNIFQVFHDMVKTYAGEGIDEYPDDPESIHFVHYNCNRLFVDGSDHPFFADRLFANRLMRLVEALRLGAQQNKIYIFDGPPGCGRALSFRSDEYMLIEDTPAFDIDVGNVELCPFAQRSTVGGRVPFPPCDECVRIRNMGPVGIGIVPVGDCHGLRPSLPPALYHGACGTRREAAVSELKPSQGDEQCE